MNNNLFFIIKVIVEGILISCCSFLGKQYTYSLIVINLILISIFGQKLSPVFGILSNGGNIFYATAMICFLMLIEKYGEEEFKNVVTVCTMSIISFEVLSILTVQILSVKYNEGVGNSLYDVFRFAPRAV